MIKHCPNGCVKIAPCVIKINSQYALSCPECGAEGAIVNSPELAVLSWNGGKREGDDGKPVVLAKSGTVK